MSGRTSGHGWSSGTAAHRARRSHSVTLGGNQGRLGPPPEAARSAGPPRSRPGRMDQSREAHRSARPLHSPEGGRRQDRAVGAQRVSATSS